MKFPRWFDRRAVDAPLGKEGEPVYRDPFCSCPETTFSGGPTDAEIRACREASGSRTHEIISTEDLSILIELGKFAVEVRDEMRKRREQE